MADLTAFFKTDLVDDHLAAHMNVLIAAALRAEYTNTETITATKALSDNDCQFQVITASGADRTVELAPEATTNHITIIYNTGATYKIPVKDDSGSVTLITLGVDEWAMFTPISGETWKVISGNNMVPNDADHGWVESTATWSYSSADSPTFVASVNADMTGLISVGMRIRLVQTTTKYFIVTAVGSYSGGATLITLYGGTDYTLANAAITSPYYAAVKAPFGFPMSPAKWTVTATDTTQRTQATPTQNTWYNLGSFSISIPIGVWKVTYNVAAQVDDNTNTVNVFTTLSTANNSQSDAAWTFILSSALTGTTVISILQNVSVSGLITMAAKTSHYLNTKTGFTGVDAIWNRNEVSTAVIKAECAYL